MPGANETVPRWIAGRLSDWIVRRVKATAQRIPGQFPAWIIVNCMLPPEQPLQFGAGVKDLIAELVGASDGSRPPRDIPELRWLFLGSIPDGVQVAPEQRVEDNLAVQTKYDEELRECLELAGTRWASTNRCRRPWRASSRASPWISGRTIRREKCCPTRFATSCWRRSNDGAIALEDAGRSVESSGLDSKSSQEGSGRHAV
jgi:hypothetical protein